MSRAREYASQHRGLLALNAVLILALLVVTFAPGAQAQQRSNRPRGEYTMVSGRALGFSEAAVWIVDASNQEMVAMRYDRSNKSMRYLGFRDLAADLRASGRKGR